MTAAGNSGRLHLPDVTLICVDTRTHDQALLALQRSQLNIDFCKAVLIGAKPERDQHAIARASGIEWRTITPLCSIGEYSQFILQSLVDHVQTPHALIVQWDGFVTHADLWNAEFLKWDYVGPPWFKKDGTWIVGNGGFSLRSRRLLAATATLPYDGHSPEDQVICIDQRARLISEHAIQFAPPALARQFGIEQGPRADAFGFHGVEHFAHEFTDEELAGWLDSAPNVLIAHRHTRKLVKSLMRKGAWQQAMALNAKRAGLVGWDRDQALLHARAWLSRFRRAETGQAE